MKKMLAVAMMVVAMGVGACGGDSSCDDAAKNVAKLMHPSDEAKRNDEIKDIAEDCKKQKPSKEALNCAAKAKDMDALQKCPRK